MEAPVVVVAALPRYIVGEIVFVDCFVVRPVGRDLTTKWHCRSECGAQLVGRERVLRF